MAKCAACAAGPSGGEGHQNLFVLKLSGHEVQFICRACSTLWVRKRTGGDDQWRETARELAAVTIPGAMLASIRNR